MLSSHVVIRFSGQSISRTGKIMKKIIKWTSYHMEDALFEQLNREHDEDDELTDYEKDEESKYGNILDTPKKMVSLPIGVFVVDDANNPLRKYNFWMAHCNFRITGELEKILEETDGVDILRVMTPYSFVVAPGLAFDWSEVRVAIEKALRGTEQTINNPEVQKSLDDLKASYSKQYKSWIIYVFPNGHWQAAVLNNDGSNKEEFEVQAQSLRQCQEITKGLLLTSDE
jgi:hypothetical protein